MSGSFNNHARKVRNESLPFAVRAKELRSCTLQYCYGVREKSYIAMVQHLERLVDADLCHGVESNRPLLEALERMELARNQVLEIERAFACKRIRQKYKGKRVPSNAERQELADKIEAVKKAAGMSPPPKRCEKRYEKQP